MWMMSLPFNYGYTDIMVLFMKAPIQRAKACTEIIKHNRYQTHFHVNTLLKSSHQKMVQVMSLGHASACNCVYHFAALC